MEENSVVENAGDEIKTGCVNCSNPEIVAGYPTSLCHDCREKFIKYPIPKWIKLFAAAIVVILLFSLVTLPKNISLGMGMERGKIAEKEKKYVTAERDFKEVLEDIPDNIEAQGHLLISSFYNQNFKTLVETLNKLKEKKIEDQDLFKQMDNVVLKAGEYFSNDSFRTLEQKYAAQSINIPDSVYESYLQKNPGDINANFLFASQLLTEKRYEYCDSILRIDLNKDKEYFPALMLMASLKRETGEYDQSLSYCNKILDINNESILGMSTKARTFLKQKKDKEALELAGKSYKMDANSYTMATLIMAFHFNNKIKERDDLVKKSKMTADTSDQFQLKYALDVIENREKFRD